MADSLKTAMLKSGNGLGVAFATDVVHVSGQAKVQALGCAGGHTGRFEPLVQSIHTKIALDHLADLWIPLGRAPGAGRNAGFAAHTQAVIHGDDAVLATLLHGAGGAGSHTPWIFAMKTRHKDKGRPWQASDQLGADFDDLAQARPYGQVFIGFALDFTGTATDAFPGILK
jgi:hypothetical protein